MKRNMRQVWDRVNEDKFAEFFIYLRERWQDEKEYEDIEDYLTSIKKSIPEAVKMYKRPFGFDCDCSDGVLRVSAVVEGKYIKLKADARKR